MQRASRQGEGDASRTFLSYLDPTNIWKREEISDKSDDLQGNGITMSSSSDQVHKANAGRE